MYWSFFLRRYGQGWQYASSGYQDPRTALKDGDMQAWRWGVASPNSAPSPDANITFETVCKHPPQGGVAVATTAAATAVPPTSIRATPTQAVAASPSVGSPSTIAPSLTGTAETSVETLTPAPVLTAAKTPLITNHGTATATPAPQGASSNSTSGGTSVVQVAAFSVIAVVVAGAVGFALLRRRRRGV
jgi:hypothetical protein